MVGIHARSTISVSCQSWICNRDQKLVMIKWFLKIFCLYLRVCVYVSVCVSVCVCVHVSGSGRISSLQSLSSGSLGLLTLVCVYVHASMCVCVCVFAVVKPQTQESWCPVPLPNPPFTHTHTHTHTDTHTRVTQTHSLWTLPGEKLDPFARSQERRVGKECISRWSLQHQK